MRKRTEEKERQNEEKAKSNFSVSRIASSEDCRLLCVHGVSDEKSKMREKTKQKNVMHEWMRVCKRAKRD